MVRRLQDDGSKNSRRYYGLADLADQFLGVHLPKADTWRLRYGELADIPLDSWPSDAITYAAKDARVTWEVAQALAGGYLPPDLTLQTRAALALHLSSVWGLRTDAEQLDRVEQEQQRIRTEAALMLRAAGILTPKGNISMTALRKRAADVADEMGAEIEFTESGLVSVSSRTLKRLTADPLLGQFLEFQKASKILTSFVQKYRSGTSVPLCPRYKAILETGRTSCSSPNIQQVPRVGGLRQSFIPRAGRVFASCDFAQIEIVAMAQAQQDLDGFLGPLGTR